MSVYSLPTLGRISRERLSSLLLSTATAPTVAVIDVRDDDHVGGHINGSTHVPSSSLDHKIPELVRKLAGKQTVVFHCALSQQRGPSAALRYLRERQAKGLATNGEAANAEHASGAGKAEPGREDKIEDIGVQGENLEDRDSGILKTIDSPSEASETSGGNGQEVFVLDGGFVKWQEVFGNDKRLTEGYAPDVWAED